MNEFNIFLFCIIILLAVIFLVFLLPLITRIKKGKLAKNARQQINKLIIKDQITELENDKNNNLISELDYQKSLNEIESRAIEDIKPDDNSLFDNSPDEAPISKNRWTVYISTVFLVITTSSIVLYLVFGNPGAIEALSKAKQAKQEQSKQQEAQDVEQKKMFELLGQLENKMAEKPNNPEGWVLLARTYKAIGEMAKASLAFEKLQALDPKKFNQDAQMLADYADALASAQESFVGKPIELLQLALKTDRENIMALWLLGSSELEAKNYKESIKYWKRVRVLLPPNSEDRKMIQSAIDEISQTAGLDADPDKGEFTGKVAIDNQVLISGTIEVDKALIDKLSDNQTLLIIVRPPNTRMPVAVVTLQLPTIIKNAPYKFELNNANSMLSTNPLNKLTNVTIEARISNSGMAVAEVGDLHSSVQKIKIGNNSINIKINQVK